MTRINLDGFDNDVKDLNHKVVDSIVLEDDEDDDLESNDKVHKTKEVKKVEEHEVETKEEPPKEVAPSDSITEESKDVVEEEKNTKEVEQESLPEKEKENDSKQPPKLGKQNFSVYVLICCIILVLGFIILPKYLGDYTKIVNGVKVCDSKYDLKGTTLEDYFDKRVRDLKDQCVSYSDGNLYTLYYSNPKDSTKIDVEVFSRSFSIYSVKKFTIDNSGDDQSNRKIIYRIVKEFEGDEMKDLVLPSSEEKEN